MFSKKKKEKKKSTEMGDNPDNPAMPSIIIRVFVCESGGRRSELEKTVWPGWRLIFKIRDAL